MRDDPDFDRRYAEARAKMEANRLELQREHERAVRIFVGLLALAVAAWLLLLATQP